MTALYYHNTFMLGVEYHIASYVGSIAIAEKYKEGNN